MTWASAWASHWLRYSVCAAALMLLLAMLVSERGHMNVYSAKLVNEATTCKFAASRQIESDCGAGAGLTAPPSRLRSAPAPDR
jgi:hypothetical protein